MPINLKITALSDCHGYLPPVERCDLLLCAGDMSPMFNHFPDAQVEWWEKALGPWLADIPATHRILIAGNHDFCPEEYPTWVRDWAKQFGVTYLCDESTVVYDHGYGIKIYGTPWVPNLPTWAFHANVTKLQQITDAIPEDTEILIAHGPPRNLGDKMVGNVCVGSAPLREKIQRMSKLKLVATGHIHEDYGIFGLPGRPTLVANVSHVDEQYLNPRPASRFVRTQAGEYEVVRGYRSHLPLIAPEGFAIPEKKVKA